MFRGGEEERGKIIGKCVAAFPYMWFYVSATPCLFRLLLADFSLALSLLSRMWALRFVCPVCCLPISLVLSLLTSLWVLPSVCPICCVPVLTSLSLWLCSPACGCLSFIPIAVCWPLYHFVSSCQGVSAVILPFYLLPADLSFTLFLFVRLWVLPFICPILRLLTSLMFCLYSSACEWYPLFILLTIYCLLTSFVLSLLTSLWVLLLIYPICYLLTSLLSLLASLWVLPSIGLVYHLLISLLCSPACERHLFILFTVCWPFYCSVFFHQDVSNTPHLFC